MAWATSHHGWCQNRTQRHRRHVEDIIGTPANVAMGPGKFLDRNPPLDITKAREKLGFEPRFADIRASLEDYHRWLSGNY